MRGEDEKTKILLPREGFLPKNSTFRFEIEDFLFELQHSLIYIYHVRCEEKGETIGSDGLPQRKGGKAQSF